MNVFRCRTLCLFVALTVSVAMASGCGDGRPKRVPVSGQVLMDGKPLPQGFVRVIPNGGRAATGQIDAQGHFSLGTYEKNDGCILGTHGVEVVCFDTTNPNVFVSLIPDKYHAVATSGLSITIEDPTEPLTLNLSSVGQRRTKRSVNVGDSDPTAL